MEKGPRTNLKRPLRIAITGPECTGKSTLAAQLAMHYHADYIAEYARVYIERLNRPYTYEDVVHIAENQLAQAVKVLEPGKKVVFLDTYLIITKVWFDIVYGNCPSWIDKALRNETIDLYLLCNTEIPWVADPVRENGGEMRERLFKRYQTELENYSCPFSIIKGTGGQRLVNAIQVIDHFFPDLYPN